MNTKNIITFVCVMLLVGCAGDLKNYGWIKTADTGVKFEQAVANCEYDLQILGRADERNTYALFGGKQSPTYEACMKRYGYSWVKRNTTQ